jgi:hypothetical protein
MLAQGMKKMRPNPIRFDRPRLYQSRLDKNKRELVNMGLTYLFGGMVVLMSFPVMRFFA